jgi:hypothetical protein
MDSGSRGGLINVFYSHNTVQASNSTCFSSLFAPAIDDIIGKMKEYVTEYAASSERFLIEIQTVMNEYKAVQIGFC